MQIVAERLLGNGRAASILLAWLSVAFPVAAQEFDPVPMAWTVSRPLTYPDSDGRAAGAMVELAEELSQDVGFDLRPYRVSTFGQWGEDQLSGQSAILVGVARLAFLADNHVFSEQFFDTEVRYAVATHKASQFDPADVAGLKIGVLSYSSGSDPALHPGATIVEYNVPEHALIALLAGEVDAVAAETFLMFQTARAAVLDYKITFVGAPLSVDSQHVAIHESRAELLEPINAALEQMREDGRLSDILTRYSLEVPPPAPEVLVVGLANFPPYNIINGDGTYSGFGVETIQDLAKLAGLKITFKEITDAEFAAGPQPGTYDIFPQAGVNDQRRTTMDFTLPVERFEFSIFTRAGEADGLTDLDSLGTRSVGVEETNLARRFAESQGGLDVHVIEGRDRLLSALVNGEVDAILFPESTMVSEIERQNLTGAVDVVSPPFRVVERAPALRLGLGAIRERLNAVIPGYLISSDYAALREKYFGKPPFWNPGRIYLALGALAAFLFAFGSYMFWQRQQHAQRQLAFELKHRELEREQVHSEELASLINELERSNRELDEFAYTASHDLKEPLRGIAINAEFLAREEISEKGQKRVERMVYLAGRMEQLVSDLLYFSRLGRGERVMKNVDPKHLIDGITKELSEWLAERNAVIKVVTDLPWVFAERSKVKSVFQNLIVNAFKYNDADEKLVEIGYSEKAVVNGNTMEGVYWVRDNGIGIDEKNRDKIFRIFQRLNREDEYGPGTGAGLSFVRKIVEEYGGEVVFASQPGQGTTFYFTLPTGEIKN